MLASCAVDEALGRIPYDKTNCSGNGPSSMPGAGKALPLERHFRRQNILLR
jgi:hypothetical protein